MKILVDAHVFDGMFQGSRTYIRGLYREMIRQKPEWQFYLLAQDTNNLRDVFGNHENVVYLKLKSGNKFKRLLVEIPAIIREYKIDYAHFQYITPFTKPCKYIVTTHDILFEEPRFKKYFSLKYRIRNGLLFKRSARMADILLTVSEYSRRMIAEHYLDGDKKVHVISNAVEVSSPSDIDIKAEFGCENFLLYVSRIEPRKNHLGLLKAYLNLELDQRGFQLVFIGARDITDNEFDVMIAKTDQRLKGKVHFFENISNESLTSFYEQCDLVVYPSLAEGFGIPPLEGAMHKKKVVCSTATAMSEFDFFRYHVDPNDQAALETAIASALADSDENQLIKTAETIKGRYNWKRSAANLITVIENHKS